ncbi:hypothetical protein P3H15_32640 [Rhodococcus sp. T2V]|uniref:hypothetical protein n=1 Tax=Rhodococcus sp. T2V TaxID=3034164 RepID=UPI0023E1CCD1|nr:hypothetical protein [Rhodococcus sp. T2V]MDF3309768.1 hypothetical protein [Rhodococcus sp. T2V]
MITDADHFYLDRSARSLLSTRLQEIRDWIVDELDNAITRQTALGTQETTRQARSDDTADVLDLNASDAAHDLHGTLRVWTHHVCTARKLPWPGEGRAQHFARWLDGHVIDLALTEQAPVAVDEITDAWKRAKDAIDPPQGREFAGPCQSPEQPAVSCLGVYVRRGTDAWTCRTCSVTCDITAMQADLHDQVLEYGYTANQLATALSREVGDTVPYERVRNWVRRGKLSPIDADDDGTQRFSLNDALTLYNATPSRTARTA